MVGPAATIGRPAAAVAGTAVDLPAAVAGTAVGLAAAVAGSAAAVPLGLTAGVTWGAMKVDSGKKGASLNKGCVDRKPC